MRILLLGGAGAMGRRAAQDMLLDADVERLTIADRDRSAAEALAAADASGRTQALEWNAHDHAATVRAMGAHDLVASTVGPFFRFESKMITAALEAGVDYVSVCDEWDVVAETIERFDAPARRAGRRIITGLGASPGLSNVAARALVDLMAARGGSARRIDVSVFIPLNSGAGPAALRHGLHIMSGHVRSRRGGQDARTRACSESQVVDFGPLGRQRIWNMGHAEPVTLPRALPQLTDVAFSMGYGAGSQLLVWPAQWGWFDTERGADGWAKRYAWLEHRLPGRAKPCAVRVDVYGGTEHLMAMGCGSMADGTGLALSIGARMLGRGALTADAGVGVLAPEACFDPVAFLTALDAKGLRVYADTALTRPLLAELEAML
jgi:lysine 6-dehydrogenase